MDFEANNFEVEGKYRCVPQFGIALLLACAYAGAIRSACRRDEGWVDDSPPAPSFWDKLFGKKSEEDESK